MNTFTVPTNLARTILTLYAETGADWLSRLPSIVDDCARRWSLTILPPFEPLSYNYVAPVVRADGSDAVLKVGVPNPELLTEIEALRLYDGHGIVRLLDADREQGALLLERLKPGAPLSSLKDDERATSIAVQVMRQLWRPAPPEHPFPSVTRWAAGLKRLRAHFNGGSGPFPATLVEVEF
jgi:streptomycin 6-kinase